MANPFPLKIVTPHGLAYEGEAAMIVVRTSEGDTGIMKGHTNYMAAIDVGRLVVTPPEGAKRVGAVSGGFVSVVNGEASVSAITFEWAEDIDVERAQMAKEKAESLLAIKKSENDEKVARAKLRRALNRINIGGAGE